MNHFSWGGGGGLKLRHGYVTQSFENGPGCVGCTLATLGEYVLAPKLDIEPEIGVVYSFEFAVLLIIHVLIHVQYMSFD